MERFPARTSMCVRPAAMLGAMRRRRAHFDTAIHGLLLRVPIRNPVNCATIALLMSQKPPTRKRRPPAPVARPRQPLPPRRATVRPEDSSLRSTRAIEFLLRALPANWRGKARDYLILVRMDRPVGALLLLWPTWWALWLA